MSSPIQIKALPVMTVARLQRRVTAAEIGPFIRHALTTLETAIQAAAVLTSGPPRAIYPEPLDATTPGLVLVEWPVEAAFDPPPEVEIAAVPATEAACTTITLAEAAHAGTFYDAVYAWITAQNRQPAGPARELYLARKDGLSPDAAYLEIQVPLR